MRQGRTHRSTAAAGSRCRQTGRGRFPSSSSSDSCPRPLLELVVLAGATDKASWGGRASSSGAQGGKHGETSQPALPQLRSTLIVQFRRGCERDRLM